MICQISQESDHVLVVLAGRIYVEEANELRQKILEYVDREQSKFVIDMSQVEYIDSSGLGVLVAIQKKALQCSGGVMIKGIKGIVKELFELTRLTRVFEIV